MEKLKKEEKKKGKKKENDPVPLQLETQGFALQVYEAKSQLY